MQQASLEEMDLLWEKAKSAERVNNKLINNVNVSVFTGMFLLSTKIVDNLWRTVLTLCKSDIFATVLSEMPFFYTARFSFIISMLHMYSVKIGVCAVKFFSCRKYFFIAPKPCA